MTKLPDSMRAVVYTGNGTELVVDEVPIPGVGPNDLLLRVARCGVCGSDLGALRTAIYRPDRIPVGTILGHEYAGEVVAVGERVRSFALGDLVTSMAFDGCGICAACRAGRPARCPDRRSLRGAWAQFVLTSERSASRLPDGLPTATGAVVEPLAVACRAVERANLRDGDRSLVVGAGGIGKLVALVALRRGRGAVATLSRRPASDSVPGVAAVTSAAGREGIHASLGGSPQVVFDCAGTSTSLSTALSVVADGGRVVVVGAAPGEVAVQPAVALMGEVDIRFSLAYERRQFDESVALLAAEPSAFVAIDEFVVDLDTLPGAIDERLGGSSHAKVLVDPSA